MGRICTCMLIFKLKGLSLLWFAGGGIYLKGVLIQVREGGRSSFTFSQIVIRWSFILLIYNLITFVYEQYDNLMSSNIQSKDSSNSGTFCTCTCILIL